MKSLAASDSKAAKDAEFVAEYLEVLDELKNNPNSGSTKENLEKLLNEFQALPVMYLLLIILKDRI